MWRGTSLLGSAKSALLIEVVEVGNWWSETAAMIRAEVRHRVDRTVGRFNPRSSAVVTAVLIGDRAGLGAEARRRLQEGGTYHVIAISGGNIAIMSAALLLVFRLSGCSRRAASAVTICCLLGLRLNRRLGGVCHPGDICGVGVPGRDGGRPSGVTAQHVGVGGCVSDGRGSTIGG